MIISIFNPTFVINYGLGVGDYGLGEFCSVERPTTEQGKKTSKAKYRLN
jgi:hypothetical protein